MYSCLTNKIICICIVTLILISNDTDYHKYWSRVGSIAWIKWTQRLYNNICVQFFIANMILMMYQWNAIA
jgi:hypothetical protein